MSNAIQPLQTELVHRMAAAEVIDSVKAVVRELVDNALDAGATRVAIALWTQSGKVQVADNGFGLTWANLQQAAKPHTTSKIAAFEHLSALHTLGFRGEALYSLAQMGRLEICSRVQNASTGWRVVYDAQGGVVQVQETAMAVGTTVTVSHLFETWPSRQQNTAITPSSQGIQDMVGDYALCHPHVTWQVHQNHRPWFSLAPGTNAKQTALQLMAKLSPEALHYERFAITLPSTAAPQAEARLSATLEILVGLPDRYHRHRSDWVRIAVNGRRVFANASASADLGGHGPLEQSILNAFRQMVPRHRYPLCWIHLRVPAIYIDWNRTASKSHIYLHQLEDWKAQMIECLQKALNLPNHLDTTGTQLRPFLKTAEAKGRYALTAPVLNLSATLPDASINCADESDCANEPANPHPFPLGELRAIAQLHQTYIVAEHPAGVWLVEQHIAHERVLYERLCQDWQLTELETPLVLRDLTEQQIQNLAQVGLPAELFGQNRWAVRVAPKILAQRPDCLAALYELSGCADPQPALVATACRSALRNGQPLSLSEMQILLNQWQQTQHPRTCPHGRPIYLRLDELALAKFFRRPWVVGKSHGI